ncbi:MAG: helix-turn-helix transcriptional regulator [Oscillospiraceae bacterium]|nr:helix-turn-helix transcriptional regulator [Oscillospiraceae bacterium]
MRFHEILARERKARGWSQEDLAGRVQVSRQAVSKWETEDAMPDLPKLLALADALGMSLDALCGRAAPGEGETPPGPPEAPQRASKRSRWLWLVLCVLLAVCLAAGGIWWKWSRRDVVPAEEAPAESTLPETLTVSGVRFSGKSDYMVDYWFTPSISGADYLYQITFTARDGHARTFDASYSGGVCSGSATLRGGWLGYAVTISVGDGVNSRNLAVADSLIFSEGDADWRTLE